MKAINKIKPEYNQIFSSFFFAILGFQIKLLILEVKPETIVFYRSLLGTFVVGIFIVFSGNSYSKLFKPHNFLLLFLRSIFGVSAMYFGFSALQFIPLAQATTISFTKVFFVGIFATIFLKEKLELKTILFSFFGFSGIYFIIAPSTFDNFNGTILSLLSSVFVALGIISSNILIRKNSSSIIVFYNSILSTIICYIIFYDHISNIDLNKFLKLLLLTLTAIFGQLFNIESYKGNESNRIVLFSYTRIIFSFFLGYFFLNEEIYLETMIGIFIIILSTMATIKKKS